MHIHYRNIFFMKMDAILWTYLLPTVSYTYMYIFIGYIIIEIHKIKIIIQKILPSCIFFIFVYYYFLPPIILFNFMFLKYTG